MSSSGISGWALPTSAFQSGQGRLEDGWQDVLVLMRNTQQWPGGRKDVATDLTDFILAF